VSNDDLYDGSVPFRGQVVRAVLAYAGASWTEVGDLSPQLYQPL